MPERLVNVGLIGCGEVAQVVHIPTLGHLSKWYRITYLCDVSAHALDHCARKIPNPALQTTQDPAELCASTDVDVVLVINSDEYHAEHAILALRHDKHVFVEKPLALHKNDILAIIEAEKTSKGKVMVGYMRRYAAPFTDVLKEISAMDEILYVRVRDIIGPNSAFVGQSGTYPERFTDFGPKDIADKAKKADHLVAAAFKNDCGDIAITPDATRMWRILGGLGTHDLSVMREVLGKPQSIAGTALGFPFWNVLFRYPGFTVSYESGLDNIPRFDAHLEVYSANKSVRLQYDTPYIKGLPVTMHVSENVDGVYKETTIRRTYEDPYTSQLKALYRQAVHGESVKATAEDALEDIEVCGMIMKAAYGGT